MRRTFTVLAVFALTVGMLASPASAEDPIECGDTITESVTLTADLGPCPGSGLIVGADGITIDLGGHTLFGSRPAELFVDEPFSYGFGVMDAGYDNVTITNGTIERFTMGVGFRDGVSGTTISHLDIGWVLNGVDASVTFDNSISHNTFHDVSTYSVDLGNGAEQGSNVGNVLNWNTITCNDWFEGGAMMLHNIVGTNVNHNTFNGCWSGVHLTDISGTNLVHNTISGACIGVELNYASRTKLVHNEISVIEPCGPVGGAVTVINGEPPKIIPHP